METFSNGEGKQRFHHMHELLQASVLQKSRRSKPSRPCPPLVSIGSRLETGQQTNIRNDSTQSTENRQHIEAFSLTLLASPTTPRTEASEGRVDFGDSSIGYNTAGEEDEATCWDINGQSPASESKGSKASGSALPSFVEDRSCEDKPVDGASLAHILSTFTPDFIAAHSREVSCSPRFQALAATNSEIHSWVSTVFDKVKDSSLEAKQALILTDSSSVEASNTSRASELYSDRPQLWLNDDLETPTLTSIDLEEGMDKMYKKDRGAKAEIGGEACDFLADVNHDELTQSGKEAGPIGHKASGLSKNFAEVSSKCREPTLYKDAFHQNSKLVFPDKTRQSGQPENNKQSLIVFTGSGLKVLLVSELLTKISDLGFQPQNQKLQMRRQLGTWRQQTKQHQRFLQHQRREANHIYPETQETTKNQLDRETISPKIQHVIKYSSKAPDLLSSFVVDEPQMKRGTHISERSNFCFASTLSSLNPFRPSPPFPEGFGAGPHTEDASTSCRVRRKMSSSNFRSLSTFIASRVKRRAYMQNLRTPWWMKNKKSKEKRRSDKVFVIPFGLKSFPTTLTSVSIQSTFRQILMPCEFRSKSTSLLWPFNQYSSYQSMQSCPVCFLLSIGRSGQPYANLASPTLLNRSSNLKKDRYRIDIRKRMELVETQPPAAAAFTPPATTTDALPPTDYQPPNHFDPTTIQCIHRYSARVKTALNLIATRWYLPRPPRQSSSTLSPSPQQNPPL